MPLLYLSLLIIGFTLLWNMFSPVEEEVMEEQVKTLVLLRGVPGSGKSTFARYLKGVMPDWFAAEICADDCWEYDYNTDSRGFTNDGLRAAHAECQKRVTAAMRTGRKLVIIHNTMTRKGEFSKFYKLADEYGYRVVSVIVENRHDGVSTHNVPEDKIYDMRERFDLKL